jgi:hypothetical protein
MGQGEVDALQGLAAAHGGMLTTNPTTGLPEAGFLSKILPMLAGAGLSFIPGVGPFMAAGLVGGATGLATGRLDKGLMAGLSAFGGHGVTEGLTSLGSSLTPEAGAAVGQAGVDTAAEAAARETVAAGGINNTGVAVPDLAARSQTALTGAMETAKAGAQAAPFQTLQKGFEYAVNDPSSFVNAMGGGKGALISGAAAVSPFLLAQKKYKEEPEDADPGQQYTYQTNPTDPTPEPDPYGREQTYFKPRYVYAAKGGTMQGLPSAQSNLGSYSAGGRGRLLRGPGDGVSDSIPAVIGNKQPARLADGEFVIPARIVSELGNGSTEAGAKQLYAMMDRIQRARRKTTGKKQVAKNTKAHKLMPA